MFSIVEINYIEERDLDFWITLDKHITKEELLLKVRDKRGYVLKYSEKKVGILRYGLFWDNTPFLNLMYIKNEYQKMGLGKKLVTHWENEMKTLGYKLVMTSTMVEENAQHFYRKLGYKDSGCLVMNTQPYIDTMEMFLMKSIV